MSTEPEKLSNCPSVPESLIHAKREELTDLKLNITQIGDRSLPSDLRGHLFIIAPTGTVDSGGLPFANGDSFLSGDGTIYRLDFDRPGEVRVTTRLVKPPDYYADLATWTKDEYAKYRSGY